MACCNGICGVGNGVCVKACYQEILTTEELATVDPIVLTSGPPAPLVFNAIVRIVNAYSTGVTLTRTPPGGVATPIATVLPGETAELYIQNLTTIGELSIEAAAPPGTPAGTVTITSTTVFEIPCPLTF